ETVFDPATQIATAQLFGCALIGTDLQCYGDASNGEFGNGLTGICGDAICQSDESPLTCADCGTGVLSDLMPRTYAKLAVPDDGLFACGITTGGTVECWGTNTRGQTTEHDMATGQVTSPSFNAVPVPGLDDCTAIAAGFQHACA